MPQVTCIIKQQTWIEAYAKKKMTNETKLEIWFQMNEWHSLIFNDGCRLTPKCTHPNECDKWKMTSKWTRLRLSTNSLALIIWLALEIRRTQYQYHRQNNVRINERIYLCFYQSKNGWYCRDSTVGLRPIVMLMHIYYAKIQHKNGLIWYGRKKVCKCFIRASDHELSRIKSLAPIVG